MKKKSLACLLAMAMVLTLFAGCSNTTPSASNSKDPDESSDNSIDSLITSDVNMNTDAYQSATVKYPALVYAINDTPASLLPWQPTGSAVPLSMCYECLMTFDNLVGDWVFNIGIEWDKIDDLHWRMPIHEDVYDSDGNNLTAYDIIKCYDRLVDSGNASNYSAFGGVEAIDEYTLEFTWTRPIDQVGMLDRIVGGTYLYTDKAFEDHELASEICGTGPYKLVEYTGGSKIVVEARDDYWNESPSNPVSFSNVQRVEFPIIMETAQNTIALTTGAIDFSESLPADDLSKFADGGEYADDYNVVVSPGTDSGYFCANHHADAPHSEITSDINFNLAIFYALDNAAIAEVADCLEATSPGGSYGRSLQGDHVNAWDEEENYVTVYDPELAKEYLAKSSYNGESLYLLTGTRDVLKNAAIMIQAQLEAIGVHITINALEGNLEGAARKDPTAWDLMLGTCGGTFFVNGMNKICNYNESGNDYSYNFVHDEKLQELFETARGLDSHNEENTTELYHYILDNAYYNFLFVLTKTCVCTEDITNLYLGTTTLGTIMMPQAFTYATN